MEAFILKCNVFILLIASTCHAASIICYNGTMESYSRVPLDGIPALLASPCLRASRPTVLYTFGFRGRATGPATTAVLSAYLRGGKRNVLLLDWEREAASGVFGNAITYALTAVPNAVKIGNELGDALLASKMAGVSLGSVHLVGHSLGAHLLGQAGRRARSGGYTIPRITGLDPARALYESPVRVRDGLDRTCASFVDIVHTDPHKYGLREARGTVDIWPNYEAALAASQPGCPSGNFAEFSKEDLCNHDRSWQLYAESLEDPTAMPMAGAADFEDWVLRSLQLGNEHPTTLLGELTNLKARGNYYFSTNAQKPYGKGKRGLSPAVTQSVYRRRRTSPVHRRAYFTRRT